MKQYRPAFALAVLAAVLTFTAANADKARLTTHKDMMSRLASLEAVDSLRGFDRLQVTSIGESVKGKDIVMVRVSDPGKSPEETERLFIICRQHGDEPASTEAMLGLIEDLAFSIDEQTNDLLSKVSIYVVPMVNPDGADRYLRRNANGVDLNRDWLKLSQPETRCVCRAINEVNPDVLIDQHELSPGNRSSDFLETAGSESGAPAGVVAESKQLQSLITGMLRTHDIQVRSYHIDDHNPARLAHRYFPVHDGLKTFLFETRQAGMRQYQLEYRKKLHVVGTMTIAKYLAGREDELYQRIAEHDQQRWIELASRGRKASGSIVKPSQNTKAGKQ